MGENNRCRNFTLQTFFSRDNLGISTLSVCTKAYIQRTKQMPSIDSKICNSVICYSFLIKV